MAIKSTNARVDFVGYLPFNLTGVNSTTQTLASEAVTGLQIATGAVQGKRFYLAEYWANQLSTAQVPCHEGWYRIVQVSPLAVAANLQFGAVGGQLNLANGPDVVTDASTVLTLGADPVVFLGGGPVGIGLPLPPTPGNWTIVQDGGTCSLLVAAGQTVAVGSVLVATAAGTVAVSGTPITPTILATVVGIALAAVTTPSALSLTSVAAAVAGSAVYTGTITGGAANAFAGQQAVITGFTGVNTVDNGTYVITASTATTLTLSNPNAVAVTAAGTATLQSLVAARLTPTFGE